MRRVVVYELLSLDGVAEDPDGFITSFDEVMAENLAGVIGSQDAVLLGRRTFEEWAGFWPASDIEPFAGFINNVPKYVATSGPADGSWTNVTFVRRDFAAFVAELKAQPGGDIGVHGSITLAQSLLEAGLVDELRLVIAPAIQVRGRRLFERGRPERLTMTRSLTTPAGYLLADLRLAGAEAAAPSLP